MAARSYSNTGSTIKTVNTTARTVMSKGSRQRLVNKNKFDVNFEKIFGDKNNVQCQTGNQESAPGRQQGTEAGSVKNPHQPSSSVPYKE
jgi:hypothetical protein